MITRCPAAFAKVEKIYFAVHKTRIRFQCYRPKYASTNRTIQFFHSDERPVTGHSNASCEHGLHGACSNIATPAGYCSLRQRTQKRPLSIGAVGEPNCCITIRASIDEHCRICLGTLKRDRNKELVVILLLRTISHPRKVLRYEVN